MAIEEIKSGFYAVHEKNGSWRQVYPIKNDLNKAWSLMNCNWKNFIFGGDIISAISSWVILGVILYLAFCLMTVIAQYNNLIANNCVQSCIENIQITSKLNLTGI